MNTDISTESHNCIRSTCRVCSRENTPELFVLKEMMFGSREAFQYERCSRCGALQISQIPADLSRHYPENYYSMRHRSEPVEYRGIKKLMVEWYCRAAILSPASKSARAARRLLPMPTDFAEVGGYLAQSRLRSASDKILDVGCGASPYRLTAMKRCGFRFVHGIDPYIPQDLEYEGVSVKRRTIDEMPNDEYGLVMFHHSLEHVPDPNRTLLHAARLVRRGGTCLIRIPVMGTYLWRRFRENWVELDAPRHLYSFSVESMHVLAANSGFKVRQIVFDSNAWEIAASVRYERNIPLRSTPRSTDGFSKAELADFGRQVEALNKQHDAGRACFYLERQ